MINKKPSYLTGKRGQMVNYVLGGCTDVDMNEPSYRKNDHFINTLKNGNIQEGEVLKIMRTELLRPADYRAIIDGYSRNVPASAGVRSDRRKIVGMAKYLEKDLKAKDDEIVDMQAIDGWNETRRKIKNGVGEGYNYNHDFFETMSETDTEFDKISYIGNANALSYINHLHRTAWKSGSESETKNLRKLAELYNYLKGGFDDSAGIKTMGELVNDIPDHKLEQKEINALAETGLGEFEPSQFLNSTIGQRKL